MDLISELQTCTDMLAFSLKNTLTICTGITEIGLKTNGISYLQSFKMGFPSDQISSP